MGGVVVRGSGSEKYVYGSVPALIEIAYRLLVRCSRVVARAISLQV